MRSIKLACSAILLLSLIPAASCMTIIEAYSQALENNPAYLEAQSTFLAEQERIPQTRAALLPSISASASYTLDKTSSETQTLPQAGSSVVFVLTYSLH